MAKSGYKRKTTRVYRNKTGRPKGVGAWKPTAAQRERIFGYSAAGYDQETIAKRLRIDPKTLRKHCREELDYATMDLLSDATIGLKHLIDPSTKKARKGRDRNLGACCFVLKTRGKNMGWIERQEHTGKDGDAIPLHISNLSDAQLATLIGRIETALNARAIEGGTKPPDEAQE